MAVSASTPRSRERVSMSLKRIDWYVYSDRRPIQHRHRRSSSTEVVFGPSGRMLHFSATAMLKANPALQEYELVAASYKV